METLDQIKRPTKTEQKSAIQSYSALKLALSQLTIDETEGDSSTSLEVHIEIEETKEHIKIPLRALKLLSDILKAMGEGKPISIVPMATEVTTQKAAEILGCSRPHLVKLLEEGKMPFTKVGRHRRILFEDVLKYKQHMKDEQKKHLIDIMEFDEEVGLYDS